MKNFFFDDLGMTIRGVTALVMLGGAALVLLVMLGTSYSCHVAWDDRYERINWGFFSGCRVEIDGKLTPVDIIRDLEGNR